MLAERMANWVWLRRPGSEGNLYSASSPLCQMDRLSAPLNGPNCGGHRRCGRHCQIQTSKPTNRLPNRLANDWTIIQ